MSNRQARRARKAAQQDGQPYTHPIKTRTREHETREQAKAGRRAQRQAQAIAEAAAHDAARAYMTRYAANPDQRGEAA